MLFIKGVLVYFFEGEWWDKRRATMQCYNVQGVVYMEKGQFKSILAKKSDAKAIGRELAGVTNKSRGYKSDINLKRSDPSLLKH